MDINPLTHDLFTPTTGADSYKVTHGGARGQYPQDVESIYDYAENRSAERFTEFVFWGLQYPLIRYWEGAIVTQENIDEAAREWALHFGTADYFNREGWEHILNTHGGRLPLRIRAVPEGTVLPVRSLLYDVENTGGPQTAFLVGWMETMLSHVWYPSAVATQGRTMKRHMRDALAKTGDVAGLPFKLHDFGFRGVSCFEQAAIGGAAHLVNWMGSDTFAGVRLIRKYYGNGDADYMPAFSIPASEHSTVTINGRGGELDFVRSMLTNYPKDQIIACVGDSYDIEEFIRMCGRDLRGLIDGRTAPFVIRPDSSDDPLPVCVPAYHDLTGEVFGVRENDKGYKVFDAPVAIIQGDGVDLGSFVATIDALVAQNWSLDNCAFGSGGGLLQKFNRDTTGFAVKCAYAKGSDWERDVYKDPAGMKSLKASKRGRQKLVRVDGEYLTLPQDGGPDILEDVFVNGEVVRRQTWDEVKAGAEL